MRETTVRASAPVFEKGKITPVQPRPLIAVKDVFWVLYLYPIRALVRILPFGFSRWVIRAVEPLFQLAHRPRRHAVEQLLCRMKGLDAPTPEVRRTARRFVANAVVRAIDDLLLDQLAGSGKLHCRCLLGEEHLKKALDEGKGVVVVSGHFYANRAAKRYLAEIGYPLTSLLNHKPPDSTVGRLGKRFLQPRYMRFLRVVIRDEVNAQASDVSLQLLRRLRAGGAVNIHIDVGSRREQLVLPFLGSERGFATGLMEAIRLSGCVVIPMLCVGNSQDLTITFEQPIGLERADTRKEFIAANLPKIVRRIEGQIRAHPDQWELWLRL